MVIYRIGADELTNPPRNTRPIGRATDKIDSDDLSKWQPWKLFELDAFIDPDAKRKTVIQIEIDAEDILALHSALVRHYKNVIYQLEKKLKDANES